MKKLFLYFPSFLCLLWAVSSCENEVLEEREYGNKRFYGTVTDAETGRPLSGVTVELDNKPVVSTVTDSFGFYEIIIQNSRYLSYYIRATKDGYSPYEQRIQLNVGATSVSHDFEMEQGKAYLHIRNAYGADITSLDFGGDKDTLTFYLAKSGYGILNWNISYDVGWIQSVAPKSGVLNKWNDGSNKAKELITVTIDRDKVKDAINTAELTITSNDYSDEIQKLVLRVRKEDGCPFMLLEDIGIMVQLEDLGYYSYTDAKSICFASTVGGFSDWRMPTIDELKGLYTRKEEIGGFFETYYWSSTENYDLDGVGYYYTVDFSHGGVNVWNTKDKIFRVRAVRSIC